MALQIGDRVPVELGTDQNGNPVTWNSYSGKQLVIYFYPKDNTGGCTAQACNLRDEYEALQKAGYEILGVSKDSTASHQKFIAKNELPFTLIADTELTLNEAFGVWKEKKMCGKNYMGTVRTTFVVNEDGIITNIIDKVKTKEHAQQILNQ